MKWVFVQAMALIALAGPASESLAQGRGTAGGRYQTQQAVAGERLYTIHCATCHGANLAGSLEVPALRGRFVAHWAERPLGDLFACMSAAMPQHAPGSLSAEQNARILAYLLQENGMPAGRIPLPADRAQLDRIRFDAPQP